MVVNGRPLVLERRRAVADFGPVDDACLVNLRPLHRGHDLLAVRFLALDWQTNKDTQTRSRRMRVEKLRQWVRLGETGRIGER